MLRKGIVRTNSTGYSSIECEAGAEIIALNVQDSKRVIAGDEVVFDIKPDNTIAYLKVTKRLPDIYVGKVDYRNGNWVLLSDVACFTPIYIKGVSYLVPGIIVAVRIDPTSLTTPVYAKLERVLGYKEDATFLAEYAMAKFDLETAFDYKPLQWLKKANLPQVDASTTHLDQTNLPYITIDGPTTKDIDDAILVSKVAEGFTLSVAISDVSFFVKEGTELDNCAFERGTSVYLSDKTTPMFPPELSEGILSLKEGQHRLAVICDMFFNEKGELKGHSFYRAKICVNKRLTYTQAQAYLDTPQLLDDFCTKTWDGLKGLKELHQLHQKNVQIESDFNQEVDSRIVYKDSSFSIEKEELLYSHKLVEFAMLCANKCAAAQTILMKKPFLRAQDGFDEDSKSKIQTSLGVPADSSFNQLLSDIQKNVSNKIGAYVFLKNLMSPAYYTPQINEHYSLGAEAYTHFTSPIRRYSDLTVHRILLGEKLIRPLSAVAEKCSLQNKKARLCEKFYQDAAKKRLIAQSLAPLDEMSAMVLNQTEKSIKIKLEDYGLVQVISNRLLQEAGLEFNGQTQKWSDLDHGSLIKVVYTGFFEDSFGYQIKLKLPEYL